MTLLYGQRGSRVEGYSNWVFAFADGHNHFLHRTCICYRSYIHRASLLSGAELSALTFLKPRQVGPVSGSHTRQTGGFARPGGAGPPQDAARLQVPVGPRMDTLLTPLSPLPGLRSKASELCPAAPCCSGHPTQGYQDTTYL